MYIWRGGRLTSADTGCVVSSLDFRGSVCVALKEATPTCSGQSLFHLTRKCRLSTALRHHTLGEMVWQDLEIIDYFSLFFLFMYLTGILFWLFGLITVYCQKYILPEIVWILARWNWLSFKIRYPLLIVCKFFSPFSLASGGKKCHLGSTFTNRGGSLIEFVKASGK